MNTTRAFRKETTMRRVPATTTAVAGQSDYNQQHTPITPGATAAPGDLFQIDAGGSL